MPILVFERGENKGESLKLQPGQRYVFGRDPANNVTLADPLTSRRHFQVEGDADSFRLTDLESTNGTYLNDEKVASAALKVGDKIQAGDTIVSFLTDQKEETAQGLVGKTLGGYKILERVGRGGMGTVYKANQLSLNRIVALKVLSARLLKDDKFIDRFKSEARSAGGLNHPNIVGVYDVGTEGGLHFFSMEFMDGGSIQDELGRDGKLSWEDTLECLQQLSRALVFAERKDIIHRDVKPDNLMRTSDGQIKLADLGLARKGAGVSAEEEGSIFGTPHFISPEQAQGKEIDHRADLYSLGATAYRLLAGRTPFQGSNVKEIITRQITAEPPPLKQFSPEAPEELIAVVGKLMRKSPDERYETAEALQADLEKIRLKYHLGVTGGGGKGVFIAIAVAVLAVVGVVGWALTRPAPENGNGDANGNGGPVTHLPVAPPPDVTNGADTEENRRIRAENALLKIQGRESGIGALDATALAKKDDWTALAGEYEKMSADPDFEGTAPADTAAARAKKIRDTILTKEAEELATRQKAETWWNGVRTTVNGLLAEKKYAEALRKAEEAQKHKDMALVVRYLSSAAEQIDTWTSDAPGSIRQAFTAAWAQVKKDAEALRASGDVAGALAMLRDFLAVAAGDEERPPFGPARTEAGDLGEKWRGIYRASIESALAADKQLWFDTGRAVRHHADAPGGFASNPVFDFDFEAAAKVYDALAAGGEGALATEVYRKAAADRAIRYRRMEGLMVKLVERINSGPLLEEDLDLPRSVVSGRGVTVELDRKRNPTATRAELRIRRIVVIRGDKASSSDAIAWKAFTAQELWKHIFLSGGRFQMEPEDFAGAACMLAELGITERIEDIIGAAGDTLSPAERESLRFEAAAIRAWQAVVEATETAPPEEWSTAVDNFDGKYSRSFWFVLVHGHDTPGERPLLPTTLVAEWLDGKMKKLD
ncbi:MAG: FHA domain-containing serine/threonine-protein kinase [Planctomycetota bacterium]